MEDFAAMREQFRQGRASRRIEDALAIAGILQAGLYGTLEALASVGWRLGECAADTGLPWVTLAILFACVLPKTLGRATAGRIWEVIANRGKP
jgi:phenylacetate-coenzyme A ligase PaaK-like adenylate-forming protein